MKKNSLTIGSLQARPLALGTWALGGGKDWGETTESDADNTLLAALDSGINLIDTAPIYGAGLAEQRVGRVLKGKRADVLVATKCGISLHNARPDHDLRPEQIILSCEQSLRRLQTDYIDLYQIHWPDPKVPLSASLEALCKLQQQGKIRAIGLCNFSLEQLQTACELAPIVSVQGPFSLLNTQSAPIAAFCAARGISFWAYGALGGGILSGKYKKMPNLRKCDARRYFYKYYFADGFAAAVSVVEKVMQVAAAKQVPPSAVALSAVLQQPGVTGVLAGARTAMQVQANNCAAKLKLTEQEQMFLWKASAN